jgi:hypothetical protein
LPAPLRRSAGGRNSRELNAAGCALPASGLAAALIAAGLTGDAAGWCYIASFACGFFTWVAIGGAWTQGAAPALRRGQGSYADHSRRERRVGWLLVIFATLTLLNSCLFPAMVMPEVPSVHNVGALLGTVALGGMNLFGGVAMRVLLRAEPEQELASTGAAAKPWHAKFLAHPNARIEVDPRGPGRTRLRIGAPTPLPMRGNARLRPLPGRRMGAEALRAMRWVGDGAEPAKRWMAHLQEGIVEAASVAHDYRIAVTLSPQGLLLQLPGLVPDDEAFQVLKDVVAMLSAGLDTAAHEPPPEGISFTTAADLSGQCACCWEELGEAEALTVCDRCGARQHADCYEWTGGCGRFACVAGVSTEE